MQAKRTQSYGWDKRSARFRLHKFCRENNIQADIKVVAHGSEYSVINEATIKFRYSALKKKLKNIDFFESWQFFIV